MKKTILVLIIIFGNEINSQSILYKKKFKETTTFQRDENNKIVFYEIINIDTIERKYLYENALIWLKSTLVEKNDKITFENELMGTIEGESGFMVYVPSIISHMPHGKISYKVQLEIKEKKYRYYFSDFIFQYYQQDRRDFKYKPVKSALKPLEKEKYMGSQNAWNAHKVTVKETIDGQIANLKLQMAKKPLVFIEIKKDSVIKPIIKTKDW